MNDAKAHADKTAAPYILINTFVAKPGQLDQFIAFQIAETQRLAVSAKESGWISNEIYRALEGTTVTIVTRFTSREAHQRWSQRPEFAAHLKLLGPILEDGRSVPVMLAHSGRTG
jgi:heme-degrading monooxygenase HmoA